MLDEIHLVHIIKYKIKYFINKSGNFCQDYVYDSINSHK